MPLPERMKPAKISRQQLKELADMAKEILSQIDNGAEEGNEGWRGMTETMDKITASDPILLSAQRAMRSHRPALKEVYALQSQTARRQKPENPPGQR